MADISVLNTSSDLSGRTLVSAEGSYTITGVLTYSRGTSAPFVVNASAAKVSNLDADKLDGLDSTDFLTITSAAAASVSFSGGNFTADAGTWTVDSGDVNANTYVKLSKLLVWSLSLSTTSVSVATPTYLKVALPAGTTIDKRTDGAFVYSSNGGAQAAGLWVAIAGEAFVRLYRDHASTVWAIGANNTEVRATVLLTTTT